MILDTKESGVKLVTVKTQRVILPRSFAAVLRMLLLLSMLCSYMESVSEFVLDYSDAFWQIPVHKEERRFFCATAVLNGQRQYLVFLRAAQGSANAPLLWGRVIALVMRLTQALFLSDELNLMCYVDDPIAAIKGTEEQRMLMAAMVVLVWEALGFGLAYAK